MGEQHYKRVSEKILFIYNFLRGFLQRKWLKIALKTHKIAPFLKISLWGMPPNPPSNGSQLCCSRHAPNPKSFQVWPPPPGKSCIRPPGAPNSAKFRGVAEGHPRFDKGGGGCNNFLLLRVKNRNF